MVDYARDPCYLARVLHNVNMHDWQGARSDLDNMFNAPHVRDADREILLPVRRAASPIPLSERIVSQAIRYPIPSQI